MEGDIWRDLRVLGQTGRQRGYDESMASEKISEEVEGRTKERKTGERDVRESSVTEEEEEREMR